jgi:hypothetical protein
MPLLLVISLISLSLALAAAEAAEPVDGDRHWAFEPVSAVRVPDEATGLANGPLDSFIASKLAQQGLQPAGIADRRVLLRRVFFDLIGLPPDPEDVEAFLADKSPDAWAKVVERLLASPHYGERWGRHWMDVVRYADTAGDNADYPVPEARLYRDYIIDAFNADMPYDQFIREQLAGDILAKHTPLDRSAYAQTLAATGFLALARRYGTSPYELWHLTLEDTIDTTGRAFLGLTLRCARCHDHKFDPVTSEDYYGLYGIFASTQFPWTGAEEVQSKKLDRMKLVPLAPPDEAAERLAAYQRRIGELDAEFKQLEAAAVEAGEDPEPKRRLAELSEALRNLRKPGLPDDLLGAYAVEEGAVVECRRQRGGEPNQLEEIVARRAPRFLAGDESLAVPEGASGRLQLAEWLTRADHPLTARVMVNRIWQHHFGRGLVATPSNFGTSGEPPTHPELLDWLADRFVQAGWSVKGVHRLILLSNTYQATSAADTVTAEIDPTNRWHARFDRRRLDAEAIRDAMLAVAGRLDNSRPEEHPFPPIADWNWTQHNPYKAVYPSSHRSVYLMTQRIQRHPFLALFDGADPNASTDARTSATVPLQALYMLNNPFVWEQACALAHRLMESTVDAELRTEFAHRLAYARPASCAERQCGATFVEAYERVLTDSGASRSDAQFEAWASYVHILLTANEFIFVD